MNKEDIQNLNEAYEQIHTEAFTSDELEKMGQAAYNNSGLNKVNTTKVETEPTPYTIKTSRGYDVYKPYPDGEIEVESEDSEYRMYFTKDDVLILLKRFDEKIKIPNHI